MKKNNNKSHAEDMHDNYPSNTHVTIPTSNKKKVCFDKVYVREFNCDVERNSDPMNPVKLVLGNSFIDTPTRNMLSYEKQRQEEGRAERNNITDHRIKRERNASVDQKLQQSCNIRKQELLSIPIIHDWHLTSDNRIVQYSTGNFTSPVKYIDEDIVTTASGSRYRLGRLDNRIAALIKCMKITYDPKNCLEHRDLLLYAECVIYGEAAAAGQAFYKARTEFERCINLRFQSHLKANLEQLHKVMAATIGMNEQNEAEQPVSSSPNPNSKQRITDTANMAKTIGINIPNEAEQPVSST
jgi:hypothetical protein